MNIPPKTLKQQLARNGIQTKAAPRPLRKATPQGTIRTPTERRVPTVRPAGDIAGGQDVSTESLPVLEAFQEFLEAERKHARRQIMAVTAFFLILFLAVAGAGVFFGNAYFNKMQNDISYLQGELNRTKTSLKDETAAMLDGLAQRTDNLSSQMLDSDTLIKQATAEMSSTVSKSLDERLADISDIKTALSALREENQSLRHDLARIKATQQRFTKPTLISAASADPLEFPANIQTTETTREPAVSDPTHPLEIAILAPGASAAMKWRIPIAE